MDRWSAHVIGGKRTQFLGSVTAPDDHKALAEAIKVFKVPTNWQTRIIVVPLNIGWFRSKSRGR